VARGVRPAALVAAQRVTLDVLRVLEEEVRPGVSERELAARAEELARERGATGVWTPIAVGTGPGNLVCHPAFPPTDRTVGDSDVVWLDVTPDFDGWPGDATRSVVVGSDSSHMRVVSDCVRIEQALIASIVPGMPARELFGAARRLLDADGYELLDLLGNVGHDLARDGAVTGFIDPRNETPMWGCWAIEPHIGLDGVGAKFEDLVWIEPEGVVVLA
jgi:Xaa-Pro dipeptidase